MSLRRFTPYPIEADRGVAPPISITCKIASPTGWLDLNDGRRYQLEKSSFGESSTTWRKREVTSDYVEGTYVVNAVRENVVETLSVWIYGETYYDVEAAEARLVEAISQLSYQLMFRTNNSASYYDCTVGDYQTTASHEFRHAGIKLLKASVPRHPDVQLVLAAVDEL